MTGLLFIDDEEGVRRSVQRALRREPYEVFVAENGSAGVGFFERHVNEIGIVISDYKMPGPDGIETLVRIAAMNPEVARVLLTGYATLQGAIRATNEGLDGFLTKPFDNVELRHKIRDIVIKKRLKQFVSHQVYEEIRCDPCAMSPKTRKATVLFSDIRQFTRMARDRTPEQIAGLLNHHYFTPLGEVAYRHNGTVDKHMGDGIMVIFGTPASHDDDALRAAEAAVEMQEATRSINEKLRREKGCELNVGIGIATGEVVAGVFGSLRKREYTALGMPVNMAARLQKLARGGEILISESTYREIEDRYKAERVEPVVPIKGVCEPVAVYRILGRA